MVGADVPSDETGIARGGLNGGRGVGEEELDDLRIASSSSSTSTGSSESWESSSG